MEREEIIKYFITKGILSKDGTRRKNCWKDFYDEDANEVFIKFSLNYRTSDEAWFCLLHNIKPYHCEVCGQLAKFTGRVKSKIPGYLTVCENCSANNSPIKQNNYNFTISKRTKEDKENIINKRKKTNLEKYGDENYTLYGSSKFKNDLKIKYGSETYNNRERAKQTCLKKYGVYCNLSLISSDDKKLVWKENYDKILNKRKISTYKKYGVEHVGQSKDVQCKIIQTKKLKVEELENIYNCTQQRKLFKLYGQGWKSLGLEKLIIGGRKFISNNDIALIKQYANEGLHGNKYVSHKEKELLNYIKEIYNGKILENATNVVTTTKNKFYEIDIFLPDLHIGFDFDGIYWHSIKFKDKYYHQRKTKCCYEQGIQLVHIYEDDWDLRQDIIKNNILELLNNVDCTKYNWVSIGDYNYYKLSEPNLRQYENNLLYDEGTFEK